HRGASAASAVARTDAEDRAGRGRCRGDVPDAHRFPVPRPRHQLPDRARGRAETERDLLHPRRGVSGRRDEARADRAHRRAHAGRRAGAERPRVRENGRQHAGGEGARRLRHRAGDARRPQAGVAAGQQERRRARSAAGAGAGKTRVITSRIAYLVGDGHARPEEVLAVTFTNKAAEEMRARVEALLGSDCSRMWVSTFHSLCARLLRREAPAIGLSRDFVIYDSSDQLTVVKQALKELHIDDSFVQPRAALSRISHLKNRMESPDAVAAAGAGWNRRDEQIAKVYAYYLKALADSSALA